MRISIVDDTGRRERENWGILVVGISPRLYSALHEVCTTSLLPATTTTSSTIFSTPMLDSDRHRDLPSLNLNLNGLGTTYGQLKEPE